MIAAGADGCRSGWIRAGRNDRAVVVETFPDAGQLILRRPVPRILTIDIPIGLTSSGPRRCDLEARRLLGAPRASSVFAAPIRPALDAATRLEADRITRGIDDRGVNHQAFNLYGRIREVDHLLVTRRSLRRRVREVHPEVSFWAMNGCRAMDHGKKTPEGRDDRVRLLVAYFGSGVAEWMPLPGAAMNDFLDALAALWTAERILRGEARTLPSRPPRDAEGLRMEIVY